MKALTTRLYSMTWPLLLLPIMDFSFGQLPAYLKGLEFRGLVAEVITQFISGIVDAALIAFIQQAFGVALS